MMNEATDEMAYLKYLGIDIFCTFDYVGNTESKEAPIPVLRRVKVKKKGNALYFREDPPLQLSQINFYDQCIENVCNDVISEYIKENYK